MGRLNSRLFAGCVATALIACAVRADEQPGTYRQRLTDAIQTLDGANTPEDSSDPASSGPSREPSEVIYLGSPSGCQASLLDGTVAAVDLNIAITLAKSDVPDAPWLGGIMVDFDGLSLASSNSPQVAVSDGNVGVSATLAESSDESAPVTSAISANLSLSGQDAFVDLSLTSPRPGTVSISCPTQLVESPSYASFSGHPLVVQRLNAGEDVDSITADVKARAARAAERLQGNSDEILTTLLNQGIQATLDEVKAIQDALVDEKLVAFAVMPSPGKGVIRLRAAVDTSKGRGQISLLSSDMSLTAHTSDANVLSATYGDECSITMSFKGSIDRRPTTLTCTLTDNHKVLEGQTDSIRCLDGDTVVIDGAITHGDILIYPSVASIDWSSLSIRDRAIAQASLNSALRGHSDA